MVIRASDLARPAARDVSAGSAPVRRPEEMSPRMRVRRGVTLLLTTLLVPGSAQVAAGDRHRGRGALRVWLAVLAAGLLLGVGWFVDRALVVGLFTSPVTLVVLLVLLVLGALAWAWLFLDSWRLTRPRLLPVPGRAMVSALALLLVAATSGPMLYGASLVLAQRDLMRSVFGSGIRSEAVDGRFNVLLLGADSEADRMGLRPDSINLASVDAETGSTVLFALPRNLQNVPWPEGSPADVAHPQGFSCGDECLLNAVYSFGAANPELFPGDIDPGIEAMEQAVEAITGLTVNYYVLVDMGGFRSIIDAMGGIEVTVGERVPIGGGTDPIKGYIEPGRQQLDGYEALWLARSREGSSDYARMARQRCVLTAMATQLDPQTLLTRFRDIAAASQQVVETNLPDEDLGTFVDLALLARSAGITSVQFVPPLVTPVDPDYGLIRDRVQAAVAASEAAAEAEPAEPGADADADVDADVDADTDTGADADTGGDGDGSDGTGSDGTGSDETSSDEGGGEPAQDARAVCQAG